MAKIIGKPLPNIPLAGPARRHRTPLVRYDGNPIIGRDGNKRSNSVFNSAVVPYGDGFAGVFRCDSLSISMDIFAGFSKDGIHWTIDDRAHPSGGRRPGGHQPRVPLPTPASARWTANITSPGATATMAPPSAWPGPRISRPSTSWNTPSCPTTATACCSPARSRAAT